jgi:glycosyltransferase involved in cell wall biosynthesis
MDLHHHHTGQTTDACHSMHDELVSIIITAYNEESFIDQTIESYLCQSYQNVEIIVVNDGSTDRTKMILLAYAAKDPRVKVINLDRNMGKVFAQNAAFKQACGNYIAISGGDDFGLYSRIKKQIDFLKKNNLNFVFSNLFLVNEKNQCLLNKPIFFKGQPPNLTLSRIFQGKGVPGGTILFTRELAEKIYPIPTKLEYEDLWFSFIASIHGKVGYIDEPLGFYRQHSKNSYGVYKSQSYLNFRNRYLYILSRIKAYLEEMKTYLLSAKMWDQDIEKDYLFAEDLLQLKLNRKPFEQIKLWLLFVAKHRSEFSPMYIGYLFFELAIFLLWILTIAGKR